jgi:hypothetical protein
MKRSVLWILIVVASAWAVQQRKSLELAPVPQPEHSVKAPISTPTVQSEALDQSRSSWDPGLTSDAINELAIQNLNQADQNWSFQSHPYFNCVENSVAVSVWSDSEGWQKRFLEWIVLLRKRSQVHQEVWEVFEAPIAIDRANRELLQWEKADFKVLISPQFKKGERWRWRVKPHSDPPANCGP